MNKVNAFTKFIIQPNEGVLECRSEDEAYVVRLTFEAIEKFYEKIEPFLAERRKEGIIEGVVA